MPVEATEDLFARKLGRRLPVKQEALIREDEKPLAFSHGVMSPLRLAKYIILGKFPLFAHTN